MNSNDLLWPVYLKLLVPHLMCGVRRVASPSQSLFVPTRWRGTPGPWARLALMLLSHRSTKLEILRCDYIMSLARCKNLHRRTLKSLQNQAACTCALGRCLRRKNCLERFDPMLLHGYFLMCKRLRGLPSLSGGVNRRPSAKS
jgi:hypothetical protein